MEFVVLLGLDLINVRNPVKNRSFFYYVVLYESIKAKELVHTFNHSARPTQVFKKKKIPTHMKKKQKTFSYQFEVILFTCSTFTTAFIFLFTTFEL